MQPGLDARAFVWGRRAARFGGSFNRIGRPALYISLAPETALREAHQVGTLQPTTLVAYDADIGPLVDGGDAAVLKSFGILAEDLRDASWRDHMLSGRTVPTQDLAEAAISQGYAGLLVPSFARGASADACNLVLWAWKHGITVIDNENRLGFFDHCLVFSD